MPLVYLPDSTYAPAPYGQPSHYQSYQPATPSFFDDIYTHQPSSYYAAATSAPRQLDHHHLHHPHHQHQHQHQHQTASFDPVEAHKQRLIAEYAHQLEQAYPSSHPTARQPTHHHSLEAQPSAHEAERIRYLEAQLVEQRLRKQLERERAKLVAARKDEQRREYELAIRQQREQQEKVSQPPSTCAFLPRKCTADIASCSMCFPLLQQLHEARLQQQRRLVQQHQLRQAAVAEQERRQAIAYQHARQQQQQQQRQARPQHGLEGLEHLFGLLGGCQPPHEDAAPTPAPAPRPTPAPVDQHHSGGLENFIAQFTKALELEHGQSTPTPAQPQPQTQTAARPTSPPSASSSRSASPNKTNKALPPSPLTTLRSLHAKFVDLTSSQTPHLAVQLEQLLLAADGVEADGSELVRTERKKFVREVEGVLAGLEQRPVETQVAEAAEPAAESEPAAEKAVASKSLPAGDVEAPTAAASHDLNTPSPTDNVLAQATNATVETATAPTPTPVATPAATPSPIDPTNSSSAPVDAPLPASIPVASAPSPDNDDDSHSIISDTSSVASLSGSDADDSGFSSDSGSLVDAHGRDAKTLKKGKGKARKAPSVDDLEAEEERYEFV